MEYIINKINRTDLYNQSEVVRKKNKFNIENALKSIEENFLILENIRKNWE